MTPVRVLALLVTVTVAASLATTSTAAAAPRACGVSCSNLLLTVAARSCPAYTDITANRARNNIQESLKDLGKDSPYVAGQPISPAIEDANQPKCEPIPDWTFTLGSGYRSLAVPGPWGNLSIVTGAFSSPPVTQASVPLLNTNGAPTGRKIAGAVTVTLTQDQAKLASQPNRLWIQGGTPADPILDKQYPGTYGFGALRCAIDDLNGDNVEWIGYPEGTEHVFCYAYYVKPPPTSGTIIVKKVVSAPAATAKTDFRFTGNISYTTDQSFHLAAGPGADAAATFYRAEVGTDPGAARLPWDFTEDVPAGWRLTGLSCTSQNGGSTWSTDLTSARTAVRLAASDVVTCTYTNTLTPPPSGLVISKVTLGNVGRFGWNVTGPDTASPSITTTERGVETSADPLTLAPGTYDLQETLIPISAGGKWALSQVRCNGQAVEQTQPVKLTLASNEGQACLFVNTFTPNGVIRIRKQTRGAVGTAGFVITPVATTSKSYEQHATTTHENDPVLATGDPTTHLPLGTYVIQETGASERADGVWSLDALECGGVPVPTSNGAATVTLTKDDPAIDCTFTNRFDRGGVDPGGGGGGGGDVTPAETPTANLVVTKSASPRVTRVGALVDYAITVTNAGKDPAFETTLAEQSAGRAVGIRLRASQGTCVERPPALCRLGTVRPGQRVVIHATLRAPAPGTFRNTVAANTSTAETSRAHNVAGTSIRVLPRRPRPRFVG